LTGPCPPEIIEYMFETGSAGSVVASRVTDVLEQLAAAQQELLRLDATALSRDELLDLVEVLEINARRQTAVDAR
jgi:acetyl-CoA carboxylase beta subunit